MSKTPSAILSDALTSFSRAATLAFTAAQDQARKDVTHATTDVREARRERDDAVNALHAAQLEERAWKEQAGVWKATANQAELTISHHLETIAQLRQEANQWKNQCLRLEETSRQEAISWKEQFLRVEQERSKLAQRVEELLADQLSNSGHVQASTAPYTPMPKRSAMSVSTRLQLSPSSDPPMPSLSKTTSSANRNRPGPNLQLPTPLSENQRSSRQRATQETIAPVSHPGSTSNGPRQIVIRRVHAVVEVPVKEESVDPEDVGQDPRVSTATSNVPSTSSSAPQSARATKTSKASGRTAKSNRVPRTKQRPPAKRAYVEIDDHSDQDDASHDAEQNDADEFHPVSDGDDELLMGIETNRKEVYGMKRVRQAESVTPIDHPRVRNPTVRLKRRPGLPVPKTSLLVRASKMYRESAKETERVPNP